MCARCRRKNRFRVLVVMSFAVFFAAIGDIFLSKGMKAVAACTQPGAVGIIKAVALNGYFWLGIGFLLVFMVLYLISLSWEELSYVLPLTGAIYVIVTAFAFLFLHEPVTTLRWFGSLLVAVGVVYVARS